MSDKEQIRETLSAFLDNESGKTDALETRRMAKALESDSELLMSYQRYSVASAVMRGEALGAHSTDVDAGFLGRIRNEIQEEKFAGRAVAHGPKLLWKKITSQVAVAASVAIVAIFLVQANQQDTTSGMFMTTKTHQLNDSARLGAASNRLLNPQVLTVGAGDRAIAQQSSAQHSHSAISNRMDCTNLADTNTDDNSGLYQLNLPEGYVLCRMDKNNQRCQAVSSTVACRHR